MKEETSMENKTALISSRDVMGAPPLIVSTI
jgi:hypothetical protein